MQTARHRYMPAVEADVYLLDRKRLSQVARGTRNARVRSRGMSRDKGREKGERRPELNVQ